MGIEVKGRDKPKENSSRTVPVTHISFSQSLPPSPPPLLLPSLPTSLSWLVHQAWLWEHEPRIRSHVLRRESATFGRREREAGARRGVCCSTLYDWIVIHH